MPRKRPVRSEEEERIYQQNRRLRVAENQRLRRQTTRNANHDGLRQLTQSSNLEINIDNTISRVIEQHYLGEMNILCMHCNAKHFISEKIANKGLSFSDCCSHGTTRAILL